MARLTRNSYKRKIIVFGVLVFMSIALMSTGFAAWIMSSDAKQPVDGNVSVGIVSDSSLTFTDIKGFVANGNNENGDSSDINVAIDDSCYTENGIEGIKFSFEPKKNDNTGDLRWDGDNFENLALKIIGKISNVSLVGQFTYTLTIPTSVFAAANSGYIVLPNIPSISDAKEGIDYNHVANGQTELYGNISFDSSGNFEVVIEFKWGEKYKGVNPADYFEKGNAGYGTKTSDEIKKDLEDFRAILFGYYDAYKGYDNFDSYFASLSSEEQSKVNSSSSLEFKLLIIATNNTEN